MGRKLGRDRVGISLGQCRRRRRSLVGRRATIISIDRRRKLGLGLLSLEIAIRQREVHIREHRARVHRVGRGSCRIRREEMSRLLLRVLILQSVIRRLKLRGLNLLRHRSVLVHDINQYRLLEVLTTHTSTLNLQLRILYNSSDKKQVLPTNNELARHMPRTAEKSSTHSTLLTLTDPKAHVNTVTHPIDPPIRIPFQELARTRI